jgi:hypothetical protein
VVIAVVSSFGSDSCVVSKLAQIAYGLKPLLPKTSEKLLKIIKENKKPVTPLFLRKD